VKNAYEPIEVVADKVESHSADVKLFGFKRADGKPFGVNRDGLAFVPGQFVLAGLWGHGEAPFGASSDPADDSRLEIIVRRVGRLTEALHGLKKGGRATIRGPYGNGYPLDFFKGRDVLLVTGGCGIPPISALVKHIIRNRSDFGIVRLCYGSATPNDILIKKDLKKWSGRIQVALAVERPDKAWKGSVGFVTAALKGAKVDPANTVVAMCGPGPMVGATEHLLNEIGVSDRRIFVSIERKMQCGVGRCQHCTTGTKYACADGPVFNLDEIDKNWD
jgi:NAD(P)H-flavin reductase